MIRTSLVAFFTALPLCFASHDVKPLPLPENSQLSAKIDTLNTLTILDVVRVFTGSEAGREKMKRLKGEGYACSYVTSRFARCTDHLSYPKHSEADFSNRSIKEAGKLRVLKSSELIQDPILTHESEAYSEWEVKHSITIGEDTVEYYRLRYMPGLDLFKVVPGREGFTTEYLWDGEKLRKVIDFGMSHDEGFTRYMRTVEFQ